MRRTMKKFTGKARRGTRMFLEYKKTLLLRCQKRLSVEWQRSDFKCLPERIIAFWALSPSLTSFFWTNKFGFTSDPFQRHPKTQVEKNRNQLRIVPRMILILKQRFFWANPYKIVAQMRPTTIVEQKCDDRSFFFVLKFESTNIWSVRLIWKGKVF